MFESKDFEVGSKLDKRGRVRKTGKGSDINKYYGGKTRRRGDAEGEEETDEFDEAKLPRALAGSSDESDGDAPTDESSDEGEEDEVQRRWARMRGMGGPSDSDDDEDEDDGGDSGMDSEEAEY